MTKARKSQRKPTPLRGKASPPQEEATTKRAIAWKWVNSAIVVAVVGALIPVAVTHCSNSGSTAQPSDGPKIEVDDVQVDNAGPADSGSALVSVKLRNYGNQIAVIKSATFTIQRSAVLPLCKTQGGLSNSATYQVTLPLAPKPGQVVQEPISQQEPPNSADKFSFRLGLPKGVIEGISFYDMTMTLAYDNVREPLPAGRLLVSLPSNPTGDYVWTKADALTHLAGQGMSAAETAAISGCLVSNSTAIRPMLTSTAVRSTGVTAIQSQIAYCCALKDPGTG
jgi:hypothetical protein